MEKIEHHFRVDGEWLTDFVRTRYHYEDAQDHALKVLSQIEGLSLKDAYAIINGDAEFKSEGDSDTLILNRIKNTTFKAEIAKHHEFLKNRKEEQARMDEETQSALSLIMEDADRAQRKDGHILSAVFSDAEVITRKNHRSFQMFTESILDMCCKGCENHMSCGLIYDCEKIKNKLAELPIAEPTAMTWRNFRAGKYINDKNLIDEDIIQVINFVSIPIRKSLLDEYVNQFISRVRRVQRWGEGNVWLNIEGLEELRRTLHYQILREAGYVKNSLHTDMGEDAQVFRAMIEVYVERMARRFGAIP
jgi:hypothetical protein